MDRDLAIMNRPRFRLRSVMVGVAVAALALGATVQATRLKRTAALHLARASAHGTAELKYGKRLQAIADEEQKATDRARMIETLQKEDRDDPKTWAEIKTQNQKIVAQLQALKAANAKLYDYHARMRVKYERAARHPWIFLDPDPPAPVPEGPVQ
jgi:hypothetical protein